MIKKIVLTGGPGTGKTTVLNNIYEEYTKRGYQVIIIDETATYLINKGLKPFGDAPIDMVDFQELVLKLQLAKEEVCELAARMIKDKDVLIIYDRGALDNRAYVNPKEFEDVMMRINSQINIPMLMNKYDLVIDLVGSADFYTTENNQARSESADEALRLGNVTLHCWLGHPKIKIVLPKDTIDDKVKEVLSIIDSALLDKQIKKQKKFLLALSDSDFNYINQEAQKVQIEQVYLTSDKNYEKRIRKVIFDTHTHYYMSVYKILDQESKMVVSETEITQDAYNSLLEFQDNRYETIRKTRYYFSFNGEYFTLDVFDNNPNLGILEVDFVGKREVVLPKFASILGEVKESNKQLAFKDDIKRVLAL